jgi:hypothetical protein
MQGLFDQFLKEKRFLKNITPKTAIFLCQSYKAFTRTLGEIAAILGLENAAFEVWLSDAR